MPTRPFPEVAGVAIEHEFVHARGLRFHVAVAGPPDGPPLVLVHGWPQHWWMWRKVLPALSAAHRVYCVDLRGLGWSDAPADGYEQESLADDLLAVLDALGLEQVRLVGHDWGAWSGLLLALREPRRFERIVALSVPPPWSGRGPHPRDLLEIWRLGYQLVLAAPGVGRAVLRPGPFARLLRADNVHPETFSDADVQIFADAIAEPARTRASQAIYRSFLRRDVPAQLLGRYDDVPLRVPTLLLYGAQDGVVTQRLVERGVRPGDPLTIERLQGAGHFIAEELPEAVAERALAWFSIAADDDDRT